MLALKDWLLKFLESLRLENGREKSSSSETNFDIIDPDLSYLIVHYIHGDLTEILLKSNVLK